MFLIVSHHRTANSIMIPSHKRLLLNGFLAEFGKYEHSNSDNIIVVLAGGNQSAINVMVRAAKGTVI